MYDLPDIFHCDNGNSRRICVYGSFHKKATKMNNTKIWIYAGLILILGAVNIGMLLNGEDLKKIDAEIILPDTPLPDLFTIPIPTNTPPIPPIPEPIHNLDILWDILENDTTDHHPYITSGKDTYVCVNFATDLSQNLTDAGYESGVVVRSAKWHNKGSGHILTWIQMGDDLFVIDAINDAVYWSHDFNASIDTEIYVMRYESLESGYRKCDETYRRKM